MSEKRVILVVEDEEATRETLAEMLRRMDYEVVEAKDGEEGIQIAKEREGTLFAIVTDKNMPIITGVGVAVLARYYQPNATIVMVTAYPEEALEGTLKDGGLHVLPKPLDFKALLDILNAAIKRMAQDEKRFGPPDRRGRKP